MRDCLTRRLGRPDRATAAGLADRVIDAAAVLFAAQGYGQTSISAVASRAKVGKHTLYRRFPDKASLFRAVIDRYAFKMLEEPEGGPDTAPRAIEDMRKLLERVARLGNSPTTEWVFRIAMAEARHFPELAAVLDVNKDLGLKVRLARIIERAQAENDLSAGDPLLLAELALEMLAGPFLSRRLSGDGFDQEDAFASHFSQCWSLFMDGARQRHGEPDHRGNTDARP